MTTTGPSDARGGADGAGGRASSARARAVSQLPDPIAFLGFGLIGGSIALALRAAGSRARLVAWTPDGSGPRAGLAAGVLDAAPASAEEALQGAALVILAGPPIAVLSTLDDLAGPLHAALAPDATVTDVASTKEAIVTRATTLDLPFIGGHPMAGKETTGFESASADLFVERPWVVVAAGGAAPSRGGEARDVSRVEALARACDARPVRMSAPDHDVAVAAISHLPLIAAAALVESVTGDADGWPAADALAASGWRDMTRLARGDAEMGGGILATNARAIGAAVRAYVEALDGWVSDLDRVAGTSGARGDGAERLRARLEAARAGLDAGPRP